ncbi:MAG: transposase [Candidatus Thiodiazotropha sp. (ex Ctena orbiculata)]|nr:transposase [Candidatus Thiodiazotropha taylori]
MGLTRKRHYDRYTLEFKKIVVKLADHPGVMAKEVAETLGLHPVMVYRWQMEDRRGEFRGNPYMDRQVQNARSPAGLRKTEGEKLAEQKLKQAEKRIQKLERELANRDDEIQLLKKAERFFTKIK